MDFLSQIPSEVKYLLQTLQKAGFQGYIVGGCVRDLFCGKTPSDWDVATNAAPEQIQSLFPDTFSDNKFGTVTVRVVAAAQKPLEIEVTPYRTESKYTDKRHPDKVEWADSIQDDLSRRDFTVNAIAINYIYKEDSPSQIDIIDLFEGQSDLCAKIIRAVRDPNERFLEDALRMMRAVRFAVTLGEDWRIEEKTAQAIKDNAKWIKQVSYERIRDELEKMIACPRAAKGIELLREYGLLEYVMPELAASYGVGQNKHHLYDVYWHSLKALDFAAKKNFNMYVRLASLLHDIGKPKAKAGDGLNSTFYNHEVIGARISEDILKRLRLPKKDIEKIVKLVRYHLFYYNVGEVGESSVRRLVTKVGPENVEELLQVRMADRIGSGCPKAEPYKLRHLRYLMERSVQEPISAKMLKADGQDVMHLLNITPGPKIGQILNILLGYVLEDPQKNNKEFLNAEIIRLGSLSAAELTAASRSAQQQKDTLETKRDEMTKSKYWVT